MIDGYSHLNSSINKTIELISDIESVSKEQQSGIVQINDIANQTTQIADKLVEDANAKEFKEKYVITI